MKCSSKEEHRLEVPEVRQAFLWSGHKSYDITVISLPTATLLLWTQNSQKKKGHTYVDYLAD